jgi:hypothetical protein
MREEKQNEEEKREESTHLTLSVYLIDISRLKYFQKYG